jgi:secreted trypsin-like serine protease
MKIGRLFLAAAFSALAFVGVLPAATAAAAPPAATPDSDVGVNIIGGGFASNAPWAARMFYNGRERCSATIIAPTYILTAQHCVSGTTPSGLTFRIGSLDQHSGGVLATGVATTQHSSADLAIVRINRSVSTTYSPLGTSSNVFVGQTVQVYGWGATCTNQPEINCQSRYLKVANVTVTSVSCSDYRGGIAVCARYGNGIPAGGDSGGPMFASGRQVGVASTSDRATRTAYTNITRYRTWIQSIAGV